LKERFVSHRGRRPVVFYRPHAPVRSASRDSELNNPFEIEPVHHRWLLTTCAAGIAGSLLVGGAVLSIFGQNAAPRDAFAAVRKTEQTAAPLLKGSATEGQIEEVALKPYKELSAAYQPQGNEQIIPERDFTGDNLYPEITADELPYGDGKTIVLDAEIRAAEPESANLTTITKTPPAEPIDETFKLAKGRTLTDELVDRGVTKEAAQALVAAVEPVFPAKMMKPGTEFELTLDRQQDFYGRDVTFPVEISFKPGPNETIKIEADEDGRFVASIAGAKGLTKSQYAQYNHFRTKTLVGPSLYSTAKDNKIPDYIVAEMTRVFAYDVDFSARSGRRQFRSVLRQSADRLIVERKVLHFAQLTCPARPTLFRYTTADGQTDYFDESGRSATKSLLKTPVSGARLTSGFGMRIHPLLGYSKMHTGVDFGAPYGTPIRAAGAGMIELAGRSGASASPSRSNIPATTRPSTPI
jgi:murein DD-endopeptidase MepM/ murein hydrolase activator NlpD